MLAALGLLLMIELFPPRWGELVLWSLFFWVPCGVGFSFWKHKNEQHKAENIEKVGSRLHAGSCDHVDLAVCSVACQTTSY